MGVVRRELLKIVDAFRAERLKTPHMDGYTFWRFWSFDLGLDHAQPWGCRFWRFGATTPFSETTQIEGVAAEIPRHQAGHWEPSSGCNPVYSHFGLRANVTVSGQTVRDCSILLFCRNDKRTVFRISQRHNPDGWPLAVGVLYKGMAGGLPLLIDYILETPSFEPHHADLTEAWRNRQEADTGSPT